MILGKGCRSRQRVLGVGLAWHAWRMQACTKAKTPPGGAGLSMEKRAGRGGTAGFLTMSTGAEEGSIDSCGASVHAHY